MSKRETRVTQGKKTLQASVWLGMIAFVGISLSAEAGAKKAPKAEEERVWVVRPDGTVQCESAGKDTGTKEGFQRIQKKFRDAGISVHGIETRHDGMMRVQVCGMETGNLDAVWIDASDVEKARSLGFKTFEESLRKNAL
jgi:hypothetical protein